MRAGGPGPSASAQGRIRGRRRCRGMRDRRCVACIGSSHDRGRTADMTSPSEGWPPEEEPYESIAECREGRREAAGGDDSTDAKRCGVAKLQRASVDRARMAPNVASGRLPGPSRRRSRGAVAGRGARTEPSGGREGAGRGEAHCARARPSSRRRRGREGRGERVQGARRGRGSGRAVRRPKPVAEVGVRFRSIESRIRLDLVGPEPRCPRARKARVLPVPFSPPLRGAMQRSAISTTPAAAAPAVCGPARAPRASAVSARASPSARRATPAMPVSVRRAPPSAAIAAAKRWRGRGGERGRWRGGASGWLASEADETFFFFSFSFFFSCLFRRV